MKNLSYAPIWIKYRPAILQLMVAAKRGPQEYRMLSNEFKALNGHQAGAYAFTLKTVYRKAQNNIKTSIPAQDLLAMLTSSRKAVELMDISPYEFTLDRQFVLHVSKVGM